MPNCKLIRLDFSKELSFYFRFLIVIRVKLYIFFFVAVIIAELTELKLPKIPECNIIRFFGTDIFPFICPVIVCLLTKIMLCGFK